ncbi:MAG: cytochrome c biogenesis protein CcsA [Candidatus Thalassarchaeaceae archaeon]|nr:cytochrome c biogenesis protein CcsA [Candidatus Thalassarchaeaceae archaeon]
MRNTTDGEPLLSVLGDVLLAIALITTLHQIMRPYEGSISLLRHCTLIAQMAPFLFLAYAFLLEETSLDLVSRLVGQDLPLLYRISAVWGSRSGPLLMWVSMMALVSWVMSADSSPLPLEVRIMHGWVTLLLLLSVILNPFAGAESATGELNPLLQTDLMVVHPPIVFAYYSLCMATASMALAGFIRRDPSTEIHFALLTWARPAFLFGTIGIGLGGLWAYTVLDWGGYWAWDPVETGSLLPWIALLIIIHARARPNSKGAFSVTPALALLTGSLVMHATLVTRANGVWASVHAFVADGEGALPQDPYLRVLRITDFSAEGLEVAAYLVAILFLGCFAVAHLLREQVLDLENRGRTSLYDHNKALSLLLLAFFVAVAIWIGSTAIFVVGFALMILLVSGDSENPPTHWVASGMALMLFSSWGWIAEWHQAVAGLIPFMAIWLLAEEDDGVTTLYQIFSDTSTRLKLAKATPWYIGSIFLLLTWILLTVEIDGPNLLSHELYGALLLVAMAFGLTLYAWGQKVEPMLASSTLVIALLTSISLAYFSQNFDLPGDPHLIVFTGVSRGNLSMFILTWLLFALPPTLQHLWKTLREHAPIIISEGVRTQTNASRTRLMASHIAHLGILLLLIGHVMTTTLVDRSDPSHLVTLVKDQPIEHRGFEMVFTGVEMVDSEDEDFDYEIGDGFIGIVVEIREDGETIDELMPGILRFEAPSGTNGTLVTARTEVDRMTRLTGDTIVILDIFQSNDLLRDDVMQQTSEIDRVRVTVHHLPGSHLVWAGWLLVILGGMLAVFPKGNGESYEEE